MEPSAVPFPPSYLQLYQTGELQRRAAAARGHLEHCELCPWQCGSDRLHGIGSVCRTGELARVCSYGPHMGEEAVLRGRNGSGTIFFGGCNLRCQYCQNADISQTDAGERLDAQDLAGVMLELQSSGCHNINLVTPTHVVPQILAALLVAVEAGLRLPIVYNTGGYDSLTELQLLDGVVDIYLPDMKYADPATARRYSKAPHYPEVNRAAVKEMHHQVGDLQVSPDGLARRGLLVRHLLLPYSLAGTAEIVRYLAEEISPNTWINLMDQYRPEHMVRRYPNQYRKLSRQIKLAEFQEALDLASTAGLNVITH